MSLAKTSSSPVYMRLLGGLGNQLFQYAAGRVLADSRNAELVLDYRFIKRRMPQFLHDLDHFNIRARAMTEQEMARLAEPKVAMARWLKKWHRPTFDVFWENHFAFNGELNLLQPGQMAVGFWQSQRYFGGANQYDQLRSDLALKQPFFGRALEVAEALNSSNSVAIHVRRGDYENDPKALERYGLCSMGYYQTAIELIASKVENPHFFVFSNDPQWVQQNLTIPGQCSFVSGPDLTPEQDLVLMSQCQHQIIANSTFSWWSAWLNPNKAKIVTVPQPWFEDSGFDETDLVPVEWVKLPKIQMDKQESE